MEARTGANDHENSLSTVLKATWRLNTSSISDVRAHGATTKPVVDPNHILDQNWKSLGQNVSLLLPVEPSPVTKSTTEETSTPSISPGIMLYSNVTPIPRDRMTLPSTFWWFSEYPARCELIVRGWTLASN